MDTRVAQRSSQGENNVIQTMIMALLLVISVGYVFIWIMVPTNTFKQNWLVKVRAEANSTYFGAQGWLLINLYSLVLPLIFLPQIYITSFFFFITTFLSTFYRCKFLDLHISCPFSCCLGLHLSPFKKETHHWVQFKGVSIDI